MKTPKPNTRLKRSRKGRSHLPSLSQVQRDMLRMQMQADARIPPIVANSVMASINAAANPDSEKVDVVIASLPADEKALIVPYQQSYSAIFSGVGARGSARLLSDFELDRLIEEEADNE